MDLHQWNWQRRQRWFHHGRWEAMRKWRCRGLAAMSFQDMCRVCRDKKELFMTKIQDAGQEPDMYYLTAGQEPDMKHFDGGSRTRHELLEGGSGTRHVLPEPAGLPGGGPRARQVHQGGDFANGVVSPAEAKAMWLERELASLRQAIAEEGKSNTLKTSSYWSQTVRLWER